jgi:hypothetical protein
MVDGGLYIPPKRWYIPARLRGVKIPRRHTSVKFLVNVLIEMFPECVVFTVGHVVNKVFQT